MKEYKHLVGFTQETAKALETIFNSLVELTERVKKLEDDK